MRRCPDLPIPGVGCSGIRCQPWEHSGVWPPRPGPAAFPGLFIIRVAQGWDWVFIFFFPWLYQISEKRERELSLGHPVCGFAICAGSLHFHLDREAAAGSGARDRSGC